MPDHPLLVTRAGQKIQWCYFLCESVATVAIGGHPVCVACKAKVSAIQQDAALGIRTVEHRQASRRRGAIYVITTCPCGTGFSYRKRSGNIPTWCPPCRKRPVAGKRARALRRQGNRPALIRPASTLIAANAV